MNTRHIWGLVLILMLLVGELPAQELTTEIYPSEDELAEALDRGEIDSAQYYYLWQLQLFGLDSSNIFLEDIIPNLTHFLPLPQEMIAELQQTQREPFVKDQPSRRQIGYLRQRWHRALEQNTPWAFNTDLSLAPASDVNLDLSLRRSPAGTERIVRRSLTLTPENSPLRRLTLGNFTARFGMGSIIGHPAKLLDYPDKLTGQSFLFPDYAGYNGLLATWRTGLWQAESIAAISRGSNYELTTAATIIQRSVGSAQLGLISSFNRLRRRADEAANDDLNLGVSGHNRYRSGYVRGEVSYQFGDQPSWRAALLEGRHRFRKAQVSYALWSYGNRWYDLTAGSKSAILRVADSVSALDFAYSSRRVSQKGGLLRTILKLTPSLDLTNDLLAGYHSAGSDRFQWLSALDWQASGSLQWRFDLLFNSRYLTTTTTPRQNDLRIRLQSRFTRAQWSLRSYIALQTREDRPDYGSLMLDTHIRSAQFGRIDLWVNVARWNLKQRTLDYYYMYLQITQHYTKSLDIGLKLSHRYARDYSDTHETSIAITTTVSL